MSVNRGGLPSVLYSVVVGVVVSVVLYVGIPAPWVSRKWWRVFHMPPPRENEMRKKNDVNVKCNKKMEPGGNTGLDSTRNQRRGQSDTPLTIFLYYDYSEWRTFDAIPRVVELSKMFHRESFNAPSVPLSGTFGLS